MKPRGAEAPSGAYGVSRAVNEEMMNGLGEQGRPRSGWDPYEVWLTRVRGSSPAMRERERDPLR